MTALDTARALGLSEKEVTAAQDLTPNEAARRLGISTSEATDLVAPLGTAPAAPAAPTAVAGTIVSPTSVSVAFTAGATNGGDVQYTATSTPGGFTATGGSSPLVVDAAYVEGQAYTFVVSAVSEFGSNTSAASAGVTPNPAP